MKFRDVKRKAIGCLLDEAYDHEVRSHIDVKNLLATGQVDAALAIKLISSTREDQYRCSPHHLDAAIDVHICKPCTAGYHWYVKFYFMEPDVIFISVHL